MRRPPISTLFPYTTLFRSVEAELGPRVADGLDLVADDGRDVDVGVRGDLARHHDDAGGDEGLAGHPAVRVGREDLVQDRVGDAVGQLVGMTFGYRLRRKQVPPRHPSL